MWAAGHVLFRQLVPINEPVSNINIHLHYHVVYHLQYNVNYRQFIWHSHAVYQEQTAAVV